MLTSHIDDVLHDLILDLAEPAARAAAEAHLAVCEACSQRRVAA